VTAAVAAEIVVTLTPFTYGGDALGDACQERFPIADAARAATQALRRLFGEGDEAAMTAWGGRKVGPARVIGIPRRR
jgi:hypothetical protein